MLKFSEIEAAQQRLKDSVHHTDLMYSTTFSTQTGSQVFLKCENLQKTGSFKVRGALNKIKKSALKEGDCVVSSSAGNHAQGVAYAATRRKVKSTIVMPLATPIAKVAATKSYGANVVLHGDVFDEAQKKAFEIAEQEHALYIPPFDDEDIIAGQGTIACEILKDMPDCDAIIAPVGGGGLLAGLALAAKTISPKIKVIGVQAENAAAAALSFQEKRAIELTRVFTIADGIAVKRPGDITMSIINKYADDIVTVSDNDIAATIIALLERCKQVVEPAGAAGLAAALTGKVCLMKKKVACVLSGGNIDVGFMHKIIEKGLISRGRQIRLSIILSDKPGSLQKLTQVITNTGANIIAIDYDRVSTELSLNETILHIAFEISGFEHGNQLREALTNEGYKIIGY